MIKRTGLSIFCLILCSTIPRVDAGVIERVSVSSTGMQGNKHSIGNSISADGRFVAFSSSATNLVENDTNNADDIFVYDRNTGITKRVNVSSAGVQSNALSGVSYPAISANGQFVVFSTRASNLVEGEPIPTDSRGGVFVHDRNTGETERVNISSSGEIGNGGGYPFSDDVAISADGRFVAFTSDATNLVENDIFGTDDVFVHDRNTRLTELVSWGEYTQSASRPSISADGRFIAFQDTHRSSGLANVYVRDRSTGILEIISRGISPAISADGQFVAFAGSDGISVLNRSTGETEVVSLNSYGIPANASVFYPSISADGRYIVFRSKASNLVNYDINGQEGVFVHDRQTNWTELLGLGNYLRSTPSISADGSYVSFHSIISDLVEGDTNDVADVFAVKNTLAVSNSDLITIEVLINGTARTTPDDAAQLLAGTRYQVKYKVTNNSSDRLTAVQIFENGELVCDVYRLDPGQTKQRARCATNRTVLSGDNRVTANVTGKVAGAQTRVTNTTNAYYTGIVNVTGKLRVTHRINKINADTENQAPILDSSLASILFKIENTGKIELYRVYTFHDPVSPVNSGWDQQCFIGTLKPGQIRYCKRDVSFSHSGLHKAWGRAQGRSANVSPTSVVNAANPTYFIMP